MNNSPQLQQLMRQQAQLAAAQRMLQEQQLALLKAQAALQQQQQRLQPNVQLNQQVMNARLLASMGARPQQMPVMQQVRVPVAYGRPVATPRYQSAASGMYRGPSDPRIAAMLRGAWWQRSAPVPHQREVQPGGSTAQRSADGRSADAAEAVRLGHYLPLRRRVGRRRRSGAHVVTTLPPDDGSADAAEAVRLGHYLALDETGRQTPLKCGLVTTPPPTTGRTTWPMRGLTFDASSAARTRTGCRGQPELRLRHGA